MLIRISGKGTVYEKHHTCAHHKACPSDVNYAGCSCWAQWGWRPEPMVFDPDFVMVDEDEKG